MGFNFCPCGNLGCPAKPSWSLPLRLRPRSTWSNSWGMDCLSGNSALAGPGLGSKVWKNPLRLEMRYGGQCSG